LNKSAIDAMTLQPHIFSDLYVNMVKAGEQSGSLVPVLRRMARDRALELEESMRRHEEKVGARWVGQCGRAKCHRVSKRVSDHELYYLLECSAGCRVFYHKSCWGPVTR